MQTTHMLKVALEAKDQNTLSEMNILSEIKDLANFLKNNLRHNKKLSEAFN